MNALRQLLGGMDENDPEVRNMLAQILQQEQQQQMPQPNYNIAPMQMNTMRAENGPEAGKVTSLDFGGQPQQAEKLGEGIQLADGRKGRYSADQRYAVLPTGERIDLHPMKGMAEAKAQFEAQKQAQLLAKNDADLAHTMAQTQQTQESTAASLATRSMREDPTSQAVLSKKFGKAEDGKRWTADGRLEMIPGNQKQTEANEVLQILDMAKPLVDKATGSTVGTMVDAGARLIGRTADGANEAAQLKTLEGALISKMPKMSGPQSDKDVLLYKQMAGQIGDSTIPAEQKHAAMETIRALNERYAGGAQAPQSSQTMSSMPSAKEHAGRRIQSPDGTIYKSDGKRWVRQ